MKKRESRDRLNIEVQTTSMSNKKLTGEDLIELVKYCLNYGLFINDYIVMNEPIVTVKQFCEALAKEMNYHRELDEIEGIA
jgi:hypothetical protein